MTQRKFEVGDRVVNITFGDESTFHKYLPLYAGGVITEIDFRGNIVILFDWINLTQWILPGYSDQIELEHIHNSPLNQALR